MRREGGYRDGGVERWGCGDVEKKRWRGREVENKREKKERERKENPAP